MKQLRVIISGGGTGGHIFPAIAIGKALQRLRPDTELLYVGANGKMEMEKVPLEGFKIVGLDIVGFNRAHLLKNLTLPLKLLRSRNESRRIVQLFQPDVAVGVGGYASFPLLQAAQSIGIPTLIQEQNSHAGKTNKLLGKRAEAICVAYAGMERFFPASKILLTGNPVRKEIVHNTVTKTWALQAFQLKDNVPTLLVIGGSLGALSINESIAQGLSLLMKLDIQVLWQTGTAYHTQALQHAAKYGGRVQAVAFIKDMASAYSAADVVISRAGALAIAELCIAGKPVIFVPYPHAAENHQMANALALAERGAAMVVKDDEAKDTLVKRLHDLLDDASLQERMAENIRAMAIKDADERIAHKIIGLANKV
jgi:UDP-N-acetylglucosamine--N-acetylmuramyl-(pentapeptide) pyrophosphoryl-undecaprenol N-acetylglucosamine transferase